MCGIAGFVTQPGPNNSLSAKGGCAPRVLEVIRHRGPDDHGWLRLAGTRVEKGRTWTPPTTEPEVLLLHRRLSIIDPSDAGWQPMSTSDGRYHIVYNGEIYNFVELRRELEDLGHCFRSSSDTEVLLAAYVQWGTQAFRRLVGMFAFAILDTQRRSLLLARDFFGIKPLYYAAQEGCICFGSEIKALLTFGLSQPEANPERLLFYVRYGMTDFGSDTLLSAVRQLPSAHYLEISLDEGP